MSFAQKRWQISLSNHRGFSVKISSLRDFTKLKKNKKCVYFWALNKEFYSGMFDERTFAGDFTLLVDLIRPYKYWYSMFCNCFVHSFLYWFYRFHLTHLYICLVFVLCLISHFVLQIFCLRLCIPRGFGIHWWTLKLGNLSSKVNSQHSCDLLCEECGEEFPRFKPSRGSQAINTRHRDDYGEIP